MGKGSFRMRLEVDDVKVLDLKTRDKKKMKEAFDAFSWKVD